MDSITTTRFLESRYPDPPVQLTSDLGTEIQAKTHAALSKAFRTSITPRELDVLSPRSQEYFRRTREAEFGHLLEDLLEGDKEEKIWEAVNDQVRVVGELIRTNATEGAFVLGARPSATDFSIAGSLQSVRTVHEGTFQRLVKYPGFGDNIDYRFVLSPIARPTSRCGVLTVETPCKLLMPANSICMAQCWMIRCVSSGLLSPPNYLHVG